MIKRPEGCRNFHLAEQQEGLEGAITFKTPFRLVGLESASYTYGYAEAQAYSDNQMDTNKRKPAFADLAIVLSQLSNENEAKMMGKTYEKGRKFTSTNDKAPKFAAMWEQTNSDGSSTLICFYNCTLQKEGGENTTVGESITFDTINITGKAIPLSNGDLDLMIETDDPEVKQTDVENFFKKVVLRGDNAEELVNTLDAVAMQRVEDKERFNKQKTENKK